MIEGPDEGFRWKRSPGGDGVGLEEGQRVNGQPL